MGLMKGFSLIELIVVIAIVGLLAAIGVSSYKNYTLRAQSDSIIKLMTKLQQESNLYYTKHGTWPANPTDLGYAVDGNGYIAAFNNFTPYITAVWVGNM